MFWCNDNIGGFDFQQSLLVYFNEIANLALVTIFWVVQVEVEM